MGIEGISVRKMARRELDAVIDWAASEGWNPGLNDAGCFYNADPNGFFIAVDEKGTPVGAVSAVAYDEKFGFIGLYIVRPEYRGHRVGILLGEAAMAYLGDRNIGLDGVGKKLSNYQSHGFKPAYNNIRYEGIAKECGAPSGLIDVQDTPFKELLEYDRRFFPACRKRFLLPWITQEGAFGLLCRENGKIGGYGLIRPCRSGYKIGPLFAETYETADALVAGLAGLIKPGTSFYLDIPAVNSDALRLVEKYGMGPVFRTARMYSRESPELPLEKIFGITSFELG